MSLQHSQAISPEEAREIARLATLGPSGDSTSDGPTVAGVAEALNISPSEVERLLAQVRGQQYVSPTANRTFGDRSAAWSAGFALAIVVVAALIGFGAFFAMRREDPSPAMATGTTFPAIRATGPGGTVTINGDETTDVAPEPPNGAGTPTTPSSASSSDVRPGDPTSR